MGDPATEPTLELFKSTVANAVLLSEINKLSMLHALESERYLSMAFRSWSVRVFAFAEHNQTFVDH